MPNLKPMTVSFEEVVSLLWSIGDDSVWTQIRGTVQAECRRGDGYILGSTLQLLSRANNWMSLSFLPVSGYQ